MTEGADADGSLKYMLGGGGGGKGRGSSPSFRIWKRNNVKRNGRNKKKGETANTKIILIVSL